MDRLPETESISPNTEERIGSGADHPDSGYRTDQFAQRPQMGSLKRSIADVNTAVASTTHGGGKEARIETQAAAHPQDAIIRPFEEPPAPPMSEIAPQHPPTSSPIRRIPEVCPDLTGSSRESSDRARSKDVMMSSLQQDPQSPILPETEQAADDVVAEDELRDEKSGGLYDYDPWASLEASFENSFEESLFGVTHQVAPELRLVNSLAEIAILQDQAHSYSPLLLNQQLDIATDTSTASELSYCHQHPMKTHEADSSKSIQPPCEEATNTPGFSEPERRVPITEWTSVDFLNSVLSQKEKEGWVRNPSTEKLKYFDRTRPYNKRTCVEYQLIWPRSSSRTTESQRCSPRATTSQPCSSGATTSQPIACQASTSQPSPSRTSDSQTTSSASTKSDKTLRVSYYPRYNPRYNENLSQTESVQVKKIIRIYEDTTVEALALGDEINLLDVKNIEESLRKPVQFVQEVFKYLTTAKVCMGVPTKSIAIENRLLTFTRRTEGWKVSDRIYEAQRTNGCMVVFNASSSRGKSCGKCKGLIIRRK